MEKISIIVPVYNVERYIGYCIESILNQTYQNIEVIIVDDGSTDNTPTICDEIANINSSVKVIHKENGGISRARNTGLDVATGEYIAFVDSDDFIAPDMLEKLLNSMESTGADIVLGNYAKVTAEGEVEHENRYALDETVTGYEALSWFGREHSWTYVVVWNRLYKRKLFDGLRFKEDAISEDEEIAHKLYMKCQKVASISDVIYYYRRTENSIMTKQVTVKRLDGVDALYGRFIAFQEAGLYEYLKMTLENSKNALSSLAYIRAKSSSDKEKVRKAKCEFRYMVRALGKKAGIINRIIAISPVGYYKIRKFLKKG